MSDYLAHYGRKGMKWGKHIFLPDDTRINEKGRFEINFPDGQGSANLQDRGSEYKNRLAAIRNLERIDPERARTAKNRAFNDHQSPKRHKERQAMLKSKGLNIVAAWEDDNYKTTMSDLRRKKEYNRGRELLRSHKYWAGNLIEEWS